MACPYTTATDTPLMGAFKRVCRDGTLVFVPKSDTHKTHHPSLTSTPCPRCNTAAHLAEALKLASNRVLTLNLGAKADQVWEENVRIALDANLEAALTALAHIGPRSFRTSPPPVSASSNSRPAYTHEGWEAITLRPWP